MCAKFKWGMCVQKNIKKDLAKTSMLAVLQMQDAMQKLSLMLFYSRTTLMFSYAYWKEI